MATTNSPIELTFKSALPGASNPVALTTFTSYNFERSILTPASAFRFTAPGVSQLLRQSIRSGDTVTLSVFNNQNLKLPLAVGFVDETDTHITPASVEYVISGRDTIGQLVDNASVDSSNIILNTAKITLQKIVDLLLKNTRIQPSWSISGNLPNAPLLFQTNPGETKISALQRVLEFTNCLVWSNPDGTLTVGKPDFSQAPSGKLILSSSSTRANNLLEARVKRNLNLAIRQIVTQLQSQGQVDPGSYTVQNADPDMSARSASRVGRSVYRVFSYGDGTDAVNQIYQVGNGNGAPKTLGQALSLREIARDNMHVLEVECVVQGHVNEKGALYDVNQIYSVQIDDDSVSEDMYVHTVSYELTLDHGMMTRLHLVRLGTICADAQLIAGAS